MKAYGSPAKREKDDPQNSTTTDTGETPRIEGFSSRDGNVEFARHRVKITILLPDTVSTVRIVIPTRWTKPHGTPELLRQP